MPLDVWFKYEDKVISCGRFLATENVRFKTAKPIINPYRPENGHFSILLFRILFSGQYRRPKLASGFGPHIMGGTSVQVSRKQQYSSTSRICPVLLRSIPPRARFRHHHELMESYSDNVDYESLACVLAVAIAAFTKLNHNLSHRRQGQSMSRRI